MTTSLKFLSSIPASFGTVRKLSLPKNGSSEKTIVHIQDVHMNAEAQENISKTILNLISTHKVDLIAMEGAFGPMDFTPFKQYPYQDTIQKVAGFLFKEKQMSGPILAGFTAPQPLPAFIGVDDRTHYNANVDAYRQSALRFELTKKEISFAEKQLQHEKEKTFGPNLLALDAKVMAYRAGQLSLGKYIQSLDALAPTSSLAVETFLSAYQAESSLNFILVETERARLLAQLMEKMDRSQAEDLMETSLDYRSGLLGHGAFYDYLKNLCQKNGVPLTSFPLMNSYIQYTLLSESIEADKLFSDVRGMEAAAFDAVAKTENEKILIRESRILHLAGRLADFSLTAEEWKEYKNLKASKDGVTDLKPFERFYEEAEIRDRAMGDNLQAAMNRTGAKNVVLVTGGFHSAGIESFFQGDDVTIASFVPRITKISDGSGTAYLSVFSQEKTPLEKLFAGEKLFLAPLSWTGSFLKTFSMMAVSMDFWLNRALVNIQDEISNLMVNGTGVQLAYAGTMVHVGIKEGEFNGLPQPAQPSLAKKAMSWTTSFMNRLGISRGSSRPVLVEKFGTDRLIVDDHVIGFLNQLIQSFEELDFPEIDSEKTKQIHDSVFLHQALALITKTKNKQPYLKNFVTPTLITAEVDPRIRFGLKMLTDQYFRTNDALTRSNITSLSRPGTILIPRSSLLNKERLEIALENGVFHKLWEEKKAAGDASVTLLESVFDDILTYFERIPPPQPTTSFLFPHDTDINNFSSFIIRLCRSYGRVPAKEFWIHLVESGNLDETFTHLDSSAKFESAADEYFPATFNAMIKSLRENHPQLSGMLIDCKKMALRLRAEADAIVAKDIAQIKLFPPQSIVGKWGGPTVYVFIMPFLEELARWWYDPTGSFSGAVLGFSAIHALAHIFVDVMGGQVPVAKYPFRFFFRFIISALFFGVPFWIATSLLGWDPLGGFIAAWSSHMLWNNTEGSLAMSILPMKKVMDEKRAKGELQFLTAIELLKALVLSGGNLEKAHEIMGGKPGYIRKTRIKTLIRQLGMPFLQGKTSNQKRHENALSLIRIFFPEYQPDPSDKPLNFHQIIASMDSKIKFPKFDDLREMMLRIVFSEQNRSIALSAKTEATGMSISTLRPYRIAFGLHHDDSTHPERIYPEPRSIFPATVWEIEELCLRLILHLTNGNITEAQRLLDFSQKHTHTLIKDFQINRHSSLIPHSNENKAEFHDRMQRAAYGFFRLHEFKPTAFEGMPKDIFGKLGGLIEQGMRNPLPAKLILGALVFLSPLWGRAAESSAEGAAHSLTLSPLAILILCVVPILVIGYAFFISYRSIRPPPDKYQWNVKVAIIGHPDQEHYIHMMGEDLKNNAPLRYTPIHYFVVPDQSFDEQVEKIKAVNPDIVFDYAGVGPQKLGLDRANTIFVSVQMGIPIDGRVYAWEINPQTADSRLPDLRVGHRPDEDDQTLAIVDWDHDQALLQIAEMKGLTKKFGGTPVKLKSLPAQDKSRQITYVEGFLAPLEELIRTLPYWAGVPNLFWWPLAIFPLLMAFLHLTVDDEIVRSRGLLIHRFISRFAFFSILGIPFLFGPQIFGAIGINNLDTITFFIWVPSYILHAIFNQAIAPNLPGNKGLNKSEWTFPLLSLMSVAERQIHIAGKDLGLSQKQIGTLLRAKNEISFTLWIERDSGAFRPYQGHRVQHDNEAGPFKGGTRVDKSVTLQMLRELAMEMTGKVTLHELPLGGGKGGIVADPKEFSKSERARLMRAYTRELLKRNAVGVEIDVPAPDVGTDSQWMAVFSDETIRQYVLSGVLSHPELDALKTKLRPPFFIFRNKWGWASVDKKYPGEGLETPFLEKYLEIRNQLPGSLRSLHGVVTGKPPAKGGLVTREKATGLGVAIVTREAAHRYLEREDLTGVRIALLGFGNVGMGTALELVNMGAVIVSIGEYNGVIENPKGLDVRDLATTWNRKKTFEGFTQPGTTFKKVDGVEALFVEADIAIPAARENQLNKSNIHRVQAPMIVEAANGPTTVEAENIYTGILVPDMLANSGGVKVSHDEMLFNLDQLEDASDAAVRASLDKHMTRIAKKVFDRALEDDISLRRAVGRLILETRIGKRIPNTEPAPDFVRSTIFDPEFISRERALSKKQKTVAIDLDRTLAKTDATKTYVLRPGMVDQLQKLKDSGVRLVLWTAANQLAVIEFMEKFPEAKKLFSLVITSENFRYQHAKGDAIDPTAPQWKHYLETAVKGYLSVNSQLALETIVYFYGKNPNVKDLGLLGYRVLVDDATNLENELGKSLADPYHLLKVPPFNPADLSPASELPNLFSDVSRLLKTKANFSTAALIGMIFIGYLAGISFGWIDPSDGVYAAVPAFIKLKRKPRGLQKQIAVSKVLFRDLMRAAIKLADLSSEKKVVPEGEEKKKARTKITNLIKELERIEKDILIPNSKDGFGNYRQDIGMKLNRSIELLGSAASKSQNNTAALQSLFAAAERAGMEYEKLLEFQKKSMREKSPSTPKVQFVPGLNLLRFWRGVFRKVAVGTEEISLVSPQKDESSSLWETYRFFDKPVTGELRSLTRLRLIAQELTKIQKKLSPATTPDVVEDLGNMADKLRASWLVDKELLQLIVLTARHQLLLGDLRGAQSMLARSDKLLVNLSEERIRILKTIRKTRIEPLRAMTIRRNGILERLIGEIRTSLNEENDEETLNKLNTLADKLRPSREPDIMPIAKRIDLALLNFQHYLVKKKEPAKAEATSYRKIASSYIEEATEKRRDSERIFDFMKGYWELFVSLRLNGEEESAAAMEAFSSRYKSFRDGMAFPPHGRLDRLWWMKLHTIAFVSPLVDDPINEGSRLPNPIFLARSLLVDLLEENDAHSNSAGGYPVVQGFLAGIPRVQKTIFGLSPVQKLDLLKAIARQFSTPPFPVTIDDLKAPEVMRRTAELAVNLVEATKSPEQVVDIPISMAPGAHPKKLVLLVKLFSGKLHLSTSIELLHRLHKFGYTVESARVVDGKTILERGMMGRHYALLGKVAHEGIEALTDTDRATLKEKLGSELEVKSAVQARDMGIPVDVISSLWTKGEGVRIDAERYAMAVQIPSHANIPKSLQGKKLILLNGFYFDLVSDFEKTGNKTVALTIVPIRADAADPDKMKLEFAGAPKPEEAVLGSIRRDALELQKKPWLLDELKLVFDTVIDKRANGVHLSASFAEGQPENKNWFFPLPLRNKQVKKTSWKQFVRTPVLPFVAWAVLRDSHPTLAVAFSFVLIGFIANEFLIEKKSDFNSPSARSLNELLGPMQPVLDELDGSVHHKRGVLVIMDDNMNEHRDLLENELKEAAAQGRPIIYLPVQGQIPPGGISLVSVEKELRQTGSLLPSFDVIAYEGIRFDPSGLSDDSPLRGSTYLILREILGHLAGFKESFQNLLNRIKTTNLTLQNA